MVDKTIVPFDTYLSILDKAENGPYVEEKDWDRIYIQQALTRDPRKI